MTSNAKHASQVRNSQVRNSQARNSQAAKRVCVAIGTRPEAIKMAPVVHALARQADIEPVLLTTGQHREQLHTMLQVFGLAPDVDLAVMRPEQQLADLFGRMVPAVAHYLRELRPDYLLVHGDTLTTLAVTVAGFFEEIPVAHVEAGLRTFNLKEPFPEEASRRMCDAITDLDLPPTNWARDNLLREGKAPAHMVVTGNTVVDAVQYASQHANQHASQHASEHASQHALSHLPQGLRLTVTMHRRENLPVLAKLAEVIATILREFPQFHAVYPLHLNPKVQAAVRPVLEPIANAFLEPPHDYVTMLSLLKSSQLIITDSGGIQEEGAALGVPVAVLRNVTERPEGVHAGVLELMGNDPEVVLQRLRALLADPHRLAAMRTISNPYGDGQAGRRVAQAVAWRLGLAERPVDWHYAVEQVSYD